MSVDLVSIDSEHRILIDLLNRFGEALMRDASAQAIRAIFDDIIAHALEHFAHEERVMDNIGFPRLDAHQQQHAVLLDNAEVIRLELDGQADRDKLTSVTTFLNHLVVKHMLEADMEIRDFVHRQERRRVGDGDTTPEAMVSP